MKSKKLKSLLIGLLSFLSIAGLSSCGKKGEKNPTSAPNFIEKKFVDFTEGEPNPLVLIPSDNTTNGGCFGCIWSKNNIHYNSTNGMSMSITYDESSDLYYGGELRSNTPDGKFNRGYFGVELKVAKTVGVATTFFLYTGEYEGNPHDEIDIEFLGKDTTKVQFNYFGGNDEGHEIMLDLGFDASEAFHKYGFYWDYNQIIWYVDGVAIYRATENIPFHDMRLYTNFWNGTDENGHIISGWMGKIKKESCPTTCYYKSISYADINGKGLEVPGSKPSEMDLNPSKKIDLFKNGFDSNDYFNVVKTGNFYNVESTQESKKFHHIDPNNYVFTKFGDATFSSIKIKNLDNNSYPFFFMFVDSASGSDSEGYAITNGSVISENKTSSLVSNHSTSIEFLLGANDTVEFKLDIKPGVESFSKIQIIPDAKTDQESIVHKFQIQDWYIYDNEPVSSDEGDSSYTKIDLMEYGYVGGYKITNITNGVQVDFSQKKGGWSYMAPDMEEINVSNPQFVTIKIKNNSDFGYQLVFTFKYDDVGGIKGGGVVSSSNGSTKYDHHGSNEEIFNLGANDDVVLKLLCKPEYTKYDKIQIFAAPNNQVEGGVQGSFNLTEWAIYQ